MKDNIKIAVFHNLPSGGAKRALYGFIKYLDTAGYVVDVYIPDTANETFLPLKDIASELKVFPIKKGFLRSFIHSKIPSIIKSVSMGALEKTEKK